ncbi:MAG: hypothetical protein ACOYB2_11030 [Limnohabitans sp.]
MNVDDGYLRRITPQEPLREREVLVPEELEEQVVNMTRSARRRWAREQVRALHFDADAKRGQEPPMVDGWGTLNRAQRRGHE